MKITQGLKVRAGIIWQGCKSSYTRLLKCCRNAVPLVQVLTLLALVATLIFVIIQSNILLTQTNALLIQTNTIKADYEARTQPHLAIEGVSLERDTDRVYVVIGIVNTGEVPVTNLGLVQMRMGGTWLSSGPYVYAPEYHDFPSDLVFLPGRCNRIPIPVERAIWDESFWEGKVIEIELTYVWEGTTYYYVANGKMRYDSDAKQYIDVYYDREGR